MEEMVQGVQSRSTPTLSRLGVSAAFLTLTDDASCLVSNPPNLFYRPIAYPISPDDLDQLRAMRIASGWYYERIPSWLKELETGQRLMWFIYLSDPISQVLANAANSAGSNASSPLTSTSGTSGQSGMGIQFQSFPPVGMVCLSLYNQEDPSLASFSQTGRMEICSLFVYGAYRSLGVGVAAMQNMEMRAQMMGAIFVTLNTPAVEKHLRKYTSMGYREYKPRSRVYSISDVRNAGLSEDYEVAAFLEKSLT